MIVSVAPFCALFGWGIHSSERLLCWGLKMPSPCLQAFVRRGNLRQDVAGDMSALTGIAEV